MATRERQTRPADDAVGFARTIHRVAGWCALVYALVNPVTLFLRAQYAEPPPTHGETQTLAVCSGLALVGALWFLARPTLDAGRAHVAEMEKVLRRILEVADQADGQRQRAETLARLDRMAHDLRTSIESFTFDDAQVVRVEQA